MERVFAASALDWTMVRPPELTSRPGTGRCRVREGRLPLFGLTISRADLAEYMVRIVSNPATSRKVIGISR